MKEYKMNKENSPINEFLTNPEFVRWVRSPDRALEKYWLKWMDAHPGRREDIKLAREIIQGLRFEQRSTNSATKQTVLANILNEVSSNSGQFGEEKASIKRKKGSAFRVEWLNQGSKVAAILLMAFALSLPIAYRDSSPSPPAPVPLVEIITKVTAPGEKLTLRLPDGSMVWLNAGSELQYPEAFDDAERVVHLKGEAYFEVEKGVDWPFSVVSENLITTALGTSFNIKNGSNDFLSISLLSGKVKVENDLTQENVLLLPGQQLKYSLKSEKTLIGTFDEHQVIGWKSGWLQFSNASFEEVHKDLEKWYGVSIGISGRPTRKWNLSGKYHNLDMERVFERMSYIEKFDYSIDGKNIQIKF